LPNVVTMRPSKNWFCSTPPSVFRIILELLPPPARPVEAASGTSVGSDTKPVVGLP
jgi:hypothetical protein